jgi:hypothetical protein
MVSTPSYGHSCYNQQRLNDITAPLRETTEGETPEQLEAERQAAQDFIDNGWVTLQA